MSLIKRPIIIDTLADYRRHGMNIWANCAVPTCSHGARLDLEDLIRRFGEAYEPVGGGAIEKAVVCRRCGSRGATLTISHGHATTSVGARREKGGAN